MIIKLILLQFYIPLLTAFLDRNVILDYVKVKYVNIGTIFSCQTNNENVKLIRFLGENGLRFSIVDVKRINDVAEIVLQRKYCNVAVIVDGDCDISAITNLDKKFFYETYHWLIFSQNVSLIIPHLEQANLNVNTDLNVLSPSTPTTYSILDIYNQASSHHGQLITSYLGNYSKFTSYPRKAHSNKYWLRKNMTGVRFTSAIVIPDEEVSLHVYITSEKDRQFNSMHRFQRVIVSYFREFYNFSLKLKRTNSWGYIGPSGKFDGLVGMLARREVDFGSSPLIYKLDRMPVVDYSYGNWILRSTFIYRKPKLIEASYITFMRPFSTTIWVLIGLTIGLLIVFLKIMFGRELRILSEITNETVDNSWSFLFLFTMGAFCQQGATCYPQLLSCRTLSVFVFLFCILIYQFYSASIVSFLLMDPPRRINNLQDLCDSDLRAGIEDILIDRNYFVQTTDPAAIELFKKKIQGATNDSGFYIPADGVELVRRGGFAFHVETSSAYPIIESTYTNDEICDLEEVQMYRTQPMHANLQKNSPFREMMNYFMFRLAEDGNLSRLRRFWDSRKPACIESARQVEIHVSLKEFAAGLYALGWGLVFSFAFFIFEIVMAFRRKILEMVHYPVGKKKDAIKPYTE